MQRFRNSKHKELITEINVTPLVDITLVLLIIFMVTTTYIVRMAIPIELPQAGSGEQTKGKLISVIVGPKGKIYLNEQVATDKDLDDYFTKMKKKDKDIRVIISGDRHISFGRFTEVLDKLRLLGVTYHVVNTVPLEEKDYPGAEDGDSAGKAGRKGPDDRTGAEGENRKNTEERKTP